MKEQEENTSACVFVCVCVCLSLSLSLYAYIMNENVLGGLGTSNRTEMGATFVFVFGQMLSFSDQKNLEIYVS
jgi:hypothetical protein